jgi:hypothetical protein
MQVDELTVDELTVDELTADGRADGDHLKRRLGDQLSRAAA